MIFQSFVFFHFTPLFEAVSTKPRKVSHYSIQMDVYFPNAEDVSRIVDGWEPSDPPRAVDMRKEPVVLLTDWNQRFGAVEANLRMVLPFCMADIVRTFAGERLSIHMYMICLPSTVHQSIQILNSTPHGIFKGEIATIVSHKNNGSSKKGESSISSPMSVSHRCLLLKTIGKIKLMSPRSNSEIFCKGRDYAEMCAKEIAAIYGDVHFRTTIPESQGVRSPWMYINAEEGARGLLKSIYS